MRTGKAGHGSRGFITRAHQQQQEFLTGFSKTAKKSIFKYSNTRLATGFVKVVTSCAVYHVSARLDGGRG